MTQVEFHTGVLEPVHFACRLLRKAYRQGARVAVLAPPQTLRTLDRELWTFEEREFVPHLRLGHDLAKPALLARTPLWLVEESLFSQELPAGTPDVLVNLGSDVALPAGYPARLIEIVARDADEADRARLRWRNYRSQGWNVVHHNTTAGA